MNKNEKNVVDAQGVGTKEGNVSRETNEKKERKDSFPYALKQLKAFIAKVETNKWVNDEEVKKLKEVHKKMIEKFIGIDLYED